MTSIINEVAAIIREYNPALADAWMAQPFRRVDLACAFSRGFVKNPDDDAPAFCSLILRVALADREARKITA